MTHVFALLLCQIPRPKYVWCTAPLYVRFNFRDAARRRRRPHGDFINLNVQVLGSAWVSPATPKCSAIIVIRAFCRRCRRCCVSGRSARTNTCGMLYWEMRIPLQTKRNASEVTYFVLWLSSLVLDAATKCSEHFLMKILGRRNIHD